MTSPPIPAANKMSVRSDEQLPNHGGDLTYAAAHYPMPPDGWLDLSTGINPAPYPISPIGSETLSALPDRGAYETLIETARMAYRIAPGASLIAMPGTEIALRLLPLVAPAGSVAIVTPSYESHRNAWSATERNIVEIASPADIPKDAGIVILANPNNPDGRRFPRAELEDVARRLTDKGGLLVVDEAFTDLDPQLSLAPLLGRAPAIILRSFGKFFGLAGLRLGFVAGPASIVERIAELLGDWPVSSAALLIGRTALADRKWQETTRKNLTRKAQQLRPLLERHGLSIAGGTDLFVLTAHPNAILIHARLAEIGIWTRAFSHQSKWLRFGLPADDNAFVRLDQGLASAMNEVT